jgi:hypothetical protein
MPETIETVDVTPVAFQEGTPNRDQNIRKANKAIAAMDEALKAKARFLDQLVQEEFGGIENLIAALQWLCNTEGGPEAGDQQELAATYEKLQDDHSAASRQLMEALNGV